MIAASEHLRNPDAEDVITHLRARSGKRVARAVDAQGAPQMTPDAIREAAVEDGGYETPELNDTLYLHFRGFRKIEGLDEYTGLKALWLGSNGISVLEGLPQLSELRCLFVQQNLIASIGDGLAGLRSLVQLDLSENRLTRLDGLAHLPALHTLNVAKNALADAEAVVHLTECAALTNVDLSQNRLEGGAVLDVLRAVPALVALTVAGNPFVTSVPHFRKATIATMPRLRYLDRPVFEQERLTAEAWAVGGAKAEQTARQNCQQRRRDDDRRHMTEFREWQEQQRRKHQEASDAAMAATAAAGAGAIAASQSNGTSEAAAGVMSSRPPSSPSAAATAAAAAAPAVAAAVAAAAVTTAAEKEERRTVEWKQAAAADAEVERRLVREVGVARLGTRFWANGSRGSVEDDLRTAAEQELARVDREAEAKAAAAAEASMEPKEPMGQPAVSASDQNDGATSKLPPPPEPRQFCESKKDATEHCALAVLPPSPETRTAAGGFGSGGSGGGTFIGNGAAVPTIDEAGPKALEDEAAMEETRRQRVTESLQIYRAALSAEDKQQCRPASAGAGDGTATPAPVSHVDPVSAPAGPASAATGNRSVDSAKSVSGSGSRAGSSENAMAAATAAAAATGAAQAAMVWTPEANDRLAALVHQKMFDFGAVAAAFPSPSPTAQECRLRWAQLDDDDDDEGDDADDADNDAPEAGPAGGGDSGDDGGGCCSISVKPAAPKSAPGSGAAVDAADAVAVAAVAAAPPPPVVISPFVLENAGLSFEQLAQRAAGAHSRYLQAPTALPSVDDSDADGSYGCDESDGSDCDGGAGDGGDGSNGSDGDEDVAGVLSRAQMKARAAAAARSSGRRDDITCRASGCKATAVAGRADVVITAVTTVTDCSSLD